MKKIILAFIALTTLFSFGFAHWDGADSINLYTELRSIDKWTFNEYRYLLSKEYFKLRDSMEIDSEMDEDVLNEMISLAETWYNYLWNNLDNDNYLNYLLTSLRKWLKNPSNKSHYTEIVQRLSEYIEKVDIEIISWDVEVSPESGNAPLTVTLRWKVQDPTWTKIPSYNYTWWIDTWTAQKVIWRDKSINHTFTEEWTFSIFLDVVSSHKNENGYTDVLPLRQKVDITVQEKVASLVLKVNWISVLEDQQTVKFTPEESSYWLVFDATSSVPTSGAKFTKTTWDFGNGITRSYDWPPRVERVKYSTEWDYTVKLTLVTNELKEIERTFQISIHNLIATITSWDTEGHIWDKLTFTARPSWNQKDISYAWEILDITNDKVVYRDTWKTISYEFDSKWKFNLKLSVVDSTWDNDVDTRIISINSRPPVAKLAYSIPEKNKPNMVLLDASKSYDNDFSDEWNLKFIWYVDWEKVDLENPNEDSSLGYYTFDSIWTHNVWLEVRDLDDMTVTEKVKIDINSILSVDFTTYPRAIQREWYIKMDAVSPEAEVFEWNFWDWTQKWWKQSSVTHIYDESWTYTITLKVRDEKWNINTHSKVVYVWDSDSPVALIWVSKEGTKWEIEFDSDACDWKWAYIVDKVSVVKFDSQDSINIDWKNSWLEYSWKIWNAKYSTSPRVNNKFDELWCFNVKLTVKNKDWAQSDTEEIMVDVRNVYPTLDSLDIKIQNPDGDPLVVKVSAAWAKDKDWVIQSYLWYYYTDLDSEPQDFRATNKPDTTFVIPKITGHYYFVVILKDNNEDRVSSEQITESRYFITVTWDNLNTPLINLKVNNSSVTVWDEVVFTVDAKNILWQDIKDASIYSWDFDGDWFYELETTTNTTTYKFKKSWKFYSKVKVKYKWISSTKNVTIDVLNRLYPDFDYISIWNKFIFLNKSTGQIDSLHWDLGDWTKTTSENFEHTYSDWKTTHEVRLDISEWTKTKGTTKKVIKNIKNKLKTYKDGLNIFSYPELSDDDTITLAEEWERIFFYLWESKWEIDKYIIDFDISVDSDLNWGKDDDEDNKWTASYTAWDVSNIKLNENREQVVRVFLKNESGQVIAYKDVKIIKEYIEEKEIDLETIEFKWVKDSDKEIIEKLKDLISELPTVNRLKSTEYIQRLQEQWFDNTWKTRAIIDFENYIDSENVEWSDEIIEVLESLLVDWQQDKSEKNIVFNTLKNFLPESITCTWSGWTTNCYDILIDKLERINASSDIDSNKKLWTEILEAIQNSWAMTKDDALTFKALLYKFVNGWFDNISEEDKNEIVAEDEEIGSWNDWTSTDFKWILMTVLYWVWIFFAIFLWIIVIYYIYYKIFNKNEDVWFSDFILKKTSFEEENKKDLVDNSWEDILWWIRTWASKTKEKESIIQTKSSVFSQPTQKTEPIKTENTKVEKVTSTKNETLWEKKDDKIPDWLSWSFWGGAKKQETTDNKNLNSKVETKTKTEDVKKEKTPNWLAWSMWAWDKKAETKPKTEAKVETKTKTEDVKKEKVPDWLAWSMWAWDKKVETKPKTEAKVETKPEETKKEKVPDWLAWSLDSWEKKTETKVKPEAKVEAKPEETKKEKIPDWLAWSLDSWENKAETKAKPEAKVENKTESKAESNTKEETKSETKPKPKEEAKTWWEKKTESKTPEWLWQGSFDIQENVDAKAKDANAKKDDKKDKTPTKDTKTEELWDDWMDVPDWLKN